VLFCLKRTARGGFSEGELVRRKIFGMLTMPLDRNAKARLLHRARCLMRASDGPITATASLASLKSRPLRHDAFKALLARLGEYHRAPPRPVL
jgi:hypothetical protein